MSTVCDHCRKIMVFEVKNQFVRWLLLHSNGYTDLRSLIDAMEFVFGDLKVPLFIEDKTSVENMRMLSR